jgi:hypothetical protein
LKPKDKCNANTIRWEEERMNLSIKDTLNTMIKKQTKTSRRDTLNNTEYIKDVVEKFNQEGLHNNSKQNSTFSEYIKKISNDITPQPRNNKYKIDPLKLQQKFNNLALNSSTVTQALHVIETATMLQKREKQQEDILKKTQFKNQIKHRISKKLNNILLNSSSPLKNNSFKFKPNLDLSQNDTTLNFSINNNNQSKLIQDDSN